MLATTAAGPTPPAPQAHGVLTAAESESILLMYRLSIWLVVCIECGTVSKHGFLTLRRKIYILVAFFKPSPFSHRTSWCIPQKTGASFLYFSSRVRGTWTGSSLSKAWHNNPYSMDCSNFRERHRQKSHRIFFGIPSDFLIGGSASAERLLSPLFCFLFSCVVQWKHKFLRTSSYRNLARNGAGFLRACE